MPQKNEKRDETGRPYISMFYECCNVYARIYKNKAGTAYVGWCPRCARQVYLKVGEGGVDCRMFRSG
jgi:hypothetical protein